MARTFAFTVTQAGDYLLLDPELTLEGNNPPLPYKIHRKFWGRLKLQKLGREGRAVATAAQWEHIARVNLAQATFVASLADLRIDEPTDF